MRVAGLLLAGGRSRRLGKDKRFLELDGKPLIARAYEALLEATDAVWVLLADPADEPRVRRALGDRARGLRVLLDPEPGAGPLGALAGALPRVRGDYALLLAVDYPFITGAFLSSLRAHLEAQSPKPDVLVPMWRGVPQVTCALYAAALHEELRRAVARGERSLRRAVEGLPSPRVRRLEEALWRRWTDAPDRLFRNVNTPDDLAGLTPPSPSRS